MRYQVPQFIEVEDKIFGPLTIKQFVYLAGGAGMAFLFWRLLPGLISIFLIPLVIALSLALAFYKVNNRTFVEFMESAFLYFLGNKLYLWKQGRTKPSASNTPEKTASVPRGLQVPALAQDKLKDLAWSLDIHESMRNQEQS